MCTTHELGAPGVQKASDALEGAPGVQKASDALEREFWRVVSHHVGAETNLGPL